MSSDPSEAKKVYPSLAVPRGSVDFFEDGGGQEMLSLFLTSLDFKLIVRFILLRLTVFSFFGFVFLFFVANGRLIACGIITRSWLSVAPILALSGLLWLVDPRLFRAFIP